MKRNCQFVTVAEVSYLHQAHFIKSILTNAGFRAHVVDAKSCDVLCTNIGGGIKIQVASSKAASARRLLKQSGFRNDIAA